MDLSAFSGTLKLFPVHGWPSVGEEKLMLINILSHSFSGNGPVLMHLITVRVASSIILVVGSGPNYR